MSSTPNVFEAAARWIEATLLGDVATAIAVIAMAVLGLAFMSGKLPTRRAIHVIVGCFIIFGASTIAGGIVAVVGETDPSPEGQLPPALPPVYAAPVARPISSSPFDPYAGAAVPPGR
jgi:type IV secretory pathway VirB2 component (pilin)